MVASVLLDNCGPSTQAKLHEALLEGFVLFLGPPWGKGHVREGVALAHSLLHVGVTHRFNHYYFITKSILLAIMFVSSLKLITRNA